MTYPLIWANVWRYNHRPWHLSNSSSHCSNKWSWWMISGIDSLSSFLHKRFTTQWVAGVCFFFFFHFSPLQRWSLNDVMRLIKNCSLVLPSSSLSLLCCLRAGRTTCQAVVQTDSFTPFPSPHLYLLITSICVLFNPMENNPHTHPPMCIVYV